MSNKGVKDIFFGGGARHSRPEDSDEKRHLGPVIPLDVLQEAEEERVDGHLVHAEEAAGDEVGAQADED